MGRSQNDNFQHLLANAFSNRKDLNLVMISNWDHNNYGKSLKKKYKHCENIIFHDPIYDQELLDLIRKKSFVYIHSHSQCGTAPSLVEAMSLGCAILSYDAPTNRVTTKNKALYFNDVFSLLKTIDLCNVEYLNKNRNDMYKIARKKYIWTIISNKYKSLFLS